MCPVDSTDRHTRELPFFKKAERRGTVTYRRYASQFPFIRLLETAVIGGPELEPARIVEANAVAPDGDELSEQLWRLHIQPYTRNATFPNSRIPPEIQVQDCVTLGYFYSCCGSCRKSNWYPSESFRELSGRHDEVGDHLPLVILFGPDGP
jgi:hypothetical protein